jgi:hypothetical protein
MKDTGLSNVQPIRTRLGRQVEGDLPIHELSDEIPQPILVQMIRSGGIALGNLTLDTSRSSGFYPDIVMGYSRRPMRCCAAVPSKWPGLGHQRE